MSEEHRIRFVGIQHELAPDVIRMENVAPGSPEAEAAASFAEQRQKLYDRMYYAIIKELNPDNNRAEEEVFAEFDLKIAREALAALASHLLAHALDQGLPETFAEFVKNVGVWFLYDRYTPKYPHEVLLAGTHDLSRE